MNFIEMSNPKNIECKVINLPPVNGKFVMKKQEIETKDLDRTVCLNIFSDIILFSL